VRVSVALGVAIRTLVWDQAVEEGLDIGCDVRIGVFVDGDAGRGMGNVNVANSLIDARFTHH